MNRLRSVVLRHAGKLEFSAVDQNGYRRHLLGSIQLKTKNGSLARHFEFRFRYTDNRYLVGITAGKQPLVLHLG